MTDALGAFELRGGDGRKSGRGQNGEDFTNLTAEVGLGDGLERALI
jgi:hypothetical protein